jgi:hypothetical protein
MKGKKEEAKHCNPQCNGYEWTMVSLHPLVSVIL